MLKQLYTLGSLQQTTSGLCFSIKNRLKSAHFNQIEKLLIDDQRVDTKNIMVSLNSGQKTHLSPLQKDNGVDFPLGAI